jgi:flagellar biosynthetic protein FlhB
MAEQDLDRGEAATPYKLEKARERGQVARSADLVSAVVFGVAVAYLYWVGWDGLRALFLHCRALLAPAGQVVSTPERLWLVVHVLVGEGVALLVPFLAALALAAIIANVAQTGPVLAPMVLKPDLQRVNPVAGFKRVFSLRTLFDALRAVLKLVALAWVAFEACRALVPQFFHLSAMPPGQLVRTVVEDVAAAGLRIALAMGLIALLDMVFTRRQFDRQMRMSRREITDEHKHREGDPRIKARIRELRREALKRIRSVARTGDADVLITNPTHVAVALRYVHGEMASPQLLAKGSGLLAAAMRTIAARRGIPVVRHKPLARALFHELQVDQYVPARHFSQVARILVWVYALREARQPGAAA